MFTAIAKALCVDRQQRKKVEMCSAHLKRILKLDRLRLHGPCGARDEFLLAARGLPPGVPLPRGGSEGRCAL